MANKDGVARGGTRLNLNGKDLNRGWDVPADPALVPENAALERWLERMTAAGRRPHLALELHNDASGLLHISRPPVPQLDRHLARMAILESCCGSTPGSPKEAQRRRSATRGRLVTGGCSATESMRPFMSSTATGSRSEGLPFCRTLDGIRRQTSGCISRLLCSRDSVSRCERLGRPAFARQTNCQLTVGNRRRPTWGRNSSG